MSARPKPTALKAVIGTLRAANTNLLEPEPTPGRPRKPSHFKGEKADLWEHFADLIEGMRILTLSDGAALESLVLAQLEVRALRRSIEEDGYIYESITGGEDPEETHPFPPKPERRLLKANPAVAMLNSAETRLRHLLIEFGMTPASRSKVKTVGDGGSKSKKPQARDYFGAPKAA